MNEREINVKKLFCYIISKWYLMLIGMLLGALCLGGFKYVKDYQMKNQKEEVDYESLRSKFDDEELQSINNAVNLKEDVYTVTNYMNKSYAYNLDATSVPYCGMQFCIVLENDTDEIDEMTANNLLETYSAYVLHGGLQENIGITDHDKQEYVSELISVECLKVDFTSVLYVDFIDMESLGVSVEQVTEALNDYSMVVSEKFLKHKLELISVTEGNRYDETIMIKQQNMSNYLNASESRYTKAIEKFTNEQKQYVNYLLGIEEKKVKSEEIEISIKYVFVGAILGVCLVAFCILIYYIFSPKVMSLYDYEKMFGIDYLGTFLENHDEEREMVSGLKKLEYQDVLAMDYESLIAYLTIRLEKICEKENIDKIAVISSNDRIINNDFANQLFSDCSLKNIELVLVGNVLKNANDFKEVISINNVILIEREYESVIENVRKVVDLCNNNEIKIHGVIGIV